MNVIQQVYGGVPECPDLVESDELAMILYKEYACDMFDIDPNLTDEEIKEAVTNDGDNDLYWWKL